MSERLRPDLDRDADAFTADVETAIGVLEAIVASPEALVRIDPERRRLLLELAGRASRPTPLERRSRARAYRRKDRSEDRAHDESLLAGARLRRTKALAAFLPPSVHAMLPEPPKALPDAPEPFPERAGTVTGGEPRLKKPRACYVCKASFERVHPFYDSLCPPCAEHNFAKRDQTAPLPGRVALVTGARIKIGYETALKLLRAGARVIATTRFPADAARRFAAEPDYGAYRERLEIYGIDLRHVGHVEAFADHLARTLPRLDILINNAAQTVRRPPAFYEELVENERALARDLPAGLVKASLSSAELAAIPWANETPADPRLFPLGQRDGDDQQIDLRSENSWRLTLSEVPTPELVEVHLVNAIAPFILTSRLKALMMRVPTDDKHVTHVSAMEASFSRMKKTDRHPHTNMAKAALNMMTRTSAADYAASGIFMNSVDTGWVTDEDPLHHATRKERVHDFHPPLDAIDGAARVLDPLFSGHRSGEHPYGLFFKDYRPVAW